MALGDGIRRNIAHVSQAERNLFIDAIVQLNNHHYPDGVSKWVKQDQIHEATHVHHGPSFLPWHRELLNRFEELLREIHPKLSLHYWDWTEDPRAASDGNGDTVNLFTEEDDKIFMGASSGAVGAPFAGFPSITRLVGRGNPIPSVTGVNPDTEIITSSNGFDQNRQWNRIRSKIEENHDGIHGYIGGNIGNSHKAFEDPFVFLLHSNVDRLWAMWQTVPGQEWRLDPNLTYGTEDTHPVILENLQPWAGNSGLRPWAAPDNQQEAKNSKHPTIVTPPLYDTMPIHSVASLLGTYENHLYDRGGKNNWHYVTISQISPTKLRWSNRAGVSWTLNLTPDKTKLNVGKDCPYYRSGHIQATVRWEGDRIVGIAGPSNELYNFESAGPSLSEREIVTSLLGTYENHLYDRGGKNNWHYVTLTRINDTQLRWSNRAGVSWTLTASLPDITKLNVGRDCPYYNSGYNRATIYWEGNRVVGISGPGNEFYNLENVG